MRHGGTGFQEPSRSLTLRTDETSLLGFAFECTATKYDSRPNDSWRTEVVGKGL
jgi:hypothetical protein